MGFARREDVRLKRTVAFKGEKKLLYTRCSHFSMGRMIVLNCSRLLGGEGVNNLVWLVVHRA